MRLTLLAAASALLPLQISARWVGIPTVPFEASSSKGTFSLKQLKSIIVDSAYQNTVDSKGETLIPPTLKSFASTFSDDLLSSLDLKIPVSIAKAATKNSIFLTLGNSSDYLDAAGRPTSEGYSVTVTAQGIVITGASPLGIWWGTRSILQQGVLSEKLSLGSATDSPGWGIRGTFLDVGRHYYPPEFIIEMCSYLSFFKQNTLHLHLSDSMNLNPDLTYQEKLDYYSAFRLNSDSPAVAGLNKRANESWYHSDFENMQQKCASRGVTIIPEIEAPGHALVITQWKPELALSTDFTMLNISNPETIPTMKTIWDTFMPWFHSKTVHLGADEYSSLEVAQYNLYVNTMHDYILKKYNKNVRIWGTFRPGAATDGSEINTDVSIQHWEFFEDNPYFDYIQNNYSVLNSDDQFYIVAKWSGSYPQTLNMTRIFHGAPDGGPTAPYIFDKFNATNNPPRDSPYVLGQLPALWNDMGPNSTSVIEAYYSLREGLPALGDKQWGGDLLMEEYYSIFEPLQASIPGQNLDRRIPSKTSTILSYDFSSSNSKTVKDKSGNGYHGTLNNNCDVKNSALTLRNGCEVSTPLTSKGKNYTLSFSVKPTSSAPGTLFSGSASTLKAGNGSIDNVMLVTGGTPYVLNYTLPVGLWTDVKLVGINNATYLAVTPEGSKEEAVHEFTIVIGIYSNSFVWNLPMAIEAPVAAIGGDGFEGLMKNVKLVDGADAKYAAYVAPLVIGVAPYT
ncbi:glycoside hydrolase [Leptodontidium sp. 2 PMI_412]|nr:glycoside hydrolase [Leptodontidium sp. 2 PMI_412]